MNTFGQRLRSVLDVRDIKHCEFAKQVGTYPENFSQWINGSITPTVPSVAKILRELPDIDARWLITGRAE